MTALLFCARNRKRKRATRKSLLMPGPIGTLSLRLCTGSTQRQARPKLLRLGRSAAGFAVSNERHSVKTFSHTSAPADALPSDVCNAACVIGLGPGVLPNASSDRCFFPAIHKRLIQEPNPSAEVKAVEVNCAL